MNKYIVYIQRDNGGREVYEVTETSHEAARQFALNANPLHRRCFAVVKARP